MRLRTLLGSIGISSGLTALVWIFWGYRAVDIPPDTLRSSAAVRVTDTGDGIRFDPATRKGNSGFLFLPGAMVDPIAYTPLLKSIAAAGYPAYLMRLPLRCACVESQSNELFDRISAFLRANPNIRWRIGGHSRGAMLAARYARESADNLAGLILIGTTHPRDFNIADVPIPVLKILGSHDGVANPAAARSNAANLPRSTTWVEIPGANHAQFGYYGFQLLDGEASITREAQHAETLKAIRRALGN